MPLFLIWNGFAGKTAQEAISVALRLGAISDKEYLMVGGFRAGRAAIAPKAYRICN